MGRPFSIGDVLSITSGMLVSERRIHGVYDILKFMTGERLFTHQLGRAAEVAKPVLLEKYPFLADIDTKTISAELGMIEHADARLARILIWLDDIGARYGRHLEVEPLPPGLYTPMYPDEELDMMLGGD